MQTYDTFQNGYSLQVHTQNPSQKRFELYGKIILQQLEGNSQG